MFKKSILRPFGITVAIAVNSITSPPPHIFNFHNKYVITYVTNIEIKEAKMNLMLFEKIDKIKFDTNPKNSKTYVNFSGTKLSRISQIAANIQNKIVIII